MRRACEQQTKCQRKQVTAAVRTAEPIVSLLRKSLPLSQTSTKTDGWTGTTHAKKRYTNISPNPLASEASAKNTGASRPARTPASSQTYRAQNTSDASVSTDTTHAAHKAQRVCVRISGMPEWRQSTHSAPHSGGSDCCWHDGHDAPRGAPSCPSHAYSDNHGGG